MRELVAQCPSSVVVRPGMAVPDKIERIGSQGEDGAGADDEFFDVIDDDDDQAQDILQVRVGVRVKGRGRGRGRVVPFCKYFLPPIPYPRLSGTLWFEAYTYKHINI